MLHNIIGDIMNKSIWYEGVKLNKTKQLTKDIKTDILIIGGGITGVSIAYHLKNSPYKICLVDKGTIGCSTTSKSTGKLTFLQSDIYNKIANIYNEDIALKYLKSQRHALNIIKQIIEDNNIDCDFTPTNSIVFTIKKINSLKKQYKFLKQNINIKEVDFNKYNSKYAIQVNDTYLINPLKYVNELKKILLENHIDIYEDTQIIKYTKKNNNYICKTRNNTITAKIIIIANHYPWFIKPAFIPLKSYNEKSTIVAYKNEDIKDISGINIDSETISFRPYKDYFIYLNDTHKICDNDKMNVDTFKHSLCAPKINYIWSNHDLITMDYMPLIGKVEDNMYLATGYNTWGLTNGSLAGKIISDIILNNKNEYIDLFNPKRPLNLSSLKNILSNIGYNIKAYLKEKKNIKHKYQNNQKVAIYTDDQGIKHKVKSRCPHLKCELTFNKKDNTWDCPCHGSRFDINGKCILGPSTKDITIDKE